jgi:sterol carrier protein 2
MAKIAYKNHKHSTNNPYSQFQKYYTLEDVQKSRQVFGPLTLLQCSPTSDGAACAILANEDFVKRHNLQKQAIEIVAQEMATDSRKFINGSAIEFAGSDMTRRAASQVYKKAGITPNDIQLIELHDCFSSNELITYEALGLCPEGKAHEIVDRGDNTFKGKWVVNPSGGLISKGHPLGATGIAQCLEITYQLRRWCGKRQVEGLKYALQHNIGLGGAAVVTLYKRGFENESLPSPPIQRFGYNPAVECRPIVFKANL